MAVDEAQYGLIFLNGAHEALVLAHLPAQPGQYLREDLVPFFLLQRLVLLTAEGLISFIVFFDKASGAFDEVEGQFVALFVVVIPVDQAVPAEYHASGLWMLAHYLL